MVTLSLFRHAKSAWDDRSLEDFDRPLAPRGQKAAPRMGRFMAAEKLEPDLVLCSTAIRARETLDLALPSFASRPKVGYRDELYMATPVQMMAVTCGLPAGVSHAMLIGHNPGLQALAVSLAGPSSTAAFDAMKAKFPTAGLAVFDFNCDWSEVAPGVGHLRLFMVPKRLPAG